MSLESIIARILQDAEQEAGIIRKDAEEECRRAEAEHGKKTEELYTRELERLKTRMMDLRKRRDFHVKMEASRKLKNARRTLMDQAISKAVENLVTLGDKEYLLLIDALLGRCGFDGEVFVIISPADEKRITSAYLKSRSDKKVKFTLSDERHTAAGGVILRSGSISQNATFSMIADLVHEEMIMKLASTVPLEEEG